MMYHQECQTSTQVGINLKFRQSFRPQLIFVEKSSSRCNRGTFCISPTGFTTTWTWNKQNLTQGCRGKNHYRKKPNVVHIQNYISNIFFYMLVYLFWFKFLQQLFSMFVRDFFFANIRQIFTPDEMQHCVSYHLVNWIKSRKFAVLKVSRRYKKWINIANILNIFIKTQIINTQVLLMKKDIATSLNTQQVKRWFIDTILFFLRANYYVLSCL